ncbi:MAG: acyl-CoA dehydrogenase family protein [bacterium]
MFELNEEHRMVALMVEEFAGREIEPVAAENDRLGRFPGQLVEKMGRLGLMGMMVPPEYGGSGASAVSYVLAVEGIAYACPSTAVTMSVNNLVCEPIMRYGTEAQKRGYLPGLATGGTLGAFALTEPGAGSDAASIATRAVRKGGAYVLNGRKVFITNGGYAGVFIVMARTGGAPGAKGMSAFIVESGAPGLIVGKEERKMGLRASNTVEIAFEDCETPAGNLLGGEGDGFRIAMTALDGGRIGIAAQSLGIIRACFDEAVRYSRERRQFGKALARMQAVQWMIADAARDLEAARLLVLHAAHLKDTGAAFTREAAVAKLFASEAANRVAYDALQIHGGYGYVEPSKVERLYRDARVTTIYEGTSEVQRMVIANAVLR